MDPREGEIVLAGVYHVQLPENAPVVNGSDRNRSRGLSPWPVRTGPFFEGERPERTGQSPARERVRLTRFDQFIRNGNLPWNLPNSWTCENSK